VVSFPRNLGVSSNKDKESLHEIRQRIRSNVFKHMSFRPELENLRTKKLLHGVYEPNAALNQPEALSRPVQLFLTENGSYRNTKCLITERFDRLKNLKRQISSEIKQEQNEATRRRKENLSLDMVELMMEKQRHNIAMFESGLDAAKIKRQAQGHMFAKKFSEKKFRSFKN